MSLSRRSFVGRAALAGLGSAAFPAAAISASALPSWTPGELEIHHIDTGRGNATLLVAPDATTTLIDCGEAHSSPETMPPPRPNGRSAAGEVVARYVRRQLIRVNSDVLDHALMTHLHGDHVGEIAAVSPRSQLGGYRLTGAAYLAESVRVGRWIDRGWPDYLYPSPVTDPSAQNYIAMVQSLSARGTPVERARAGSTEQLRPRRQPGRWPEFQARVLSVNGEVWTGTGHASRPHFPDIAQLPLSDLPDENMCCVSLRVDYGRFRYYTGGDLSGDTRYGRLPWHDIETPVAEAAGPVTVAAANHHGYFDACGPGMVRALRPAVWVLPTWHVTHPDLRVMANLFSPDLYAGERFIYAVELTEPAALVNSRFTGRLLSRSGHIVIRVQPGGSYTVAVIDASVEDGRPIRVDGPFAA